MSAVWARENGRYTGQDSLNMNPLLRTASDGSWALVVAALLCCCMAQDSNQGFLREPMVWHVSSEGSNSEGCGTDRLHACLSLTNVLESLGHGDKVFLHPNDHPITPPLIYNPNEEKQVKSYIGCANVNIMIPRAFSLVSEGAGVTVGCENGSAVTWRLTAMSTNMSDSGSDTVIMDGVTFLGITMVLKEVSVDIFNVRFVKSKLYLGASKIIANAKIIHSEWHGETDCSNKFKCVPVGLIFAKDSFASFEAKHSYFYHTKVNIATRLNSNIVFHKCEFSSHPDKLPVHGGATITLTKSWNSTVTFSSCRFLRQYHWNPIDSVMNLFEASLLIRYIGEQGLARTDTHNNVSVSVSDTVFEENERGLTLQGGIESVAVMDTIFKSNIAMHAGAAILLLTNRSAFVTNCTFEDNAAGDFRITQVRNPEDHFQIIGNEVQINSDCCKGSISLIGKGGAIRVQRGQLTLERCRMANNSARLLGGAVFVDREGGLRVIDTSFINDKHHRHSTQGDIMYSNGNVAIQGGSLLVRSANNHISLLQHSGEHWSMAVHDITILCPVGHRLRVMNTSSYGVTAHVGLKRSYMLDQLAYFCESCPRHKYSRDRGYLNYKLDPGQKQYYTLMINGKAPNSTFHGTYEYHDINCKECPYGAVCDHTIRALPNFWGYTHSGAIKFQLCPKGYCCSKQHCSSYDTCANNRQSILCSGCNKGYSEALFSSKCVSEEGCGPIWLWPLFFGMGFIYTLFLLFQKDVRDFIFAKLPQCPMPWSKMGRSRDLRVYENNHREAIMLNGHANEDALQGEESETNQDTYEPVEKTHTDNEESDEGGKDEAPPPSQDIGAVFLIILLYYFQDAMLFNVKTVGETPDVKNQDQIKAVILGFFKFRLEVAQFIDNVCLIPGLTPSNKLLIKTTLVPYVLVLFGLLYLAHFCYTCASRLRKDQKRDSTFEVRLCTGFMLALLFTYQRLATSAFTLLNCVHIGNVDVLFIDGRVVCYQLWQYGVLAYALCCIVPFFGVLILGPGLIKDGLVGLPAFFSACIFPLPFIFHWLRLRLTKMPPLSTSESWSLSPQAESVYKVLQGPFKDLSNKYIGPECWAGVLILRRLVLVLIFTFVNNSLIRILAMLFVSFLILLHHVHVQPYTDSRLNVAGSASVSAMMVVGGINLVRAGFEAAEYMPQGPNKILMKIMSETENVLMFWFPLLIMCIVTLALLVKVSYSIIKCLQSGVDGNLNTVETL